MARIVSTVLFVLLLDAGGARAQDVAYGVRAQNVAALEGTELQSLAARTLAASAEGTALPQRMTRANVELAGSRFAAAAATIGTIRAELGANGDRWLPFELYARARAAALERGAPFDDVYRDVFRGATEGLGDEAAYATYYWFVANVDAARASVDGLLNRHAGTQTIALADAQSLLRTWAFFDTYRSSGALAEALIAEDEAKRYSIADDVLIETPDGATLSAIVVRPRNVERVATALNFTIYTNLPGNLQTAKLAASRGYAGVVVDARGKRLSPDAPQPYETEVDDTWAAIDWAARQPWSDGQVGMFGGSYEGFTAWAATKRMHPALKTIATSAAAIPGYGLPMENNIFLNANYGWAFYVTNNKLLDDAQNDAARWGRRNAAWFASGRPYRELDQIDGGPNPWLQRWLQHPDYDAYWQAMVPYDEDFARIDIPVLTITGYYDDGQISAIRYTKEHYRHRADAEHYVVIGPYDHFGSHQAVKANVLRGYTIDPVAQFSTPDLELDWLDYVMRGAPKPQMLQDRINYEVMGANVWRHAPSIAAMSDERWKLYLTENVGGGRYTLSPQRPEKLGTIAQVVDFADRATTGAGYYPSPIVNPRPDYSRGLVFMTEPLEKAVEISGAFSGELGVTINKRDVDIMLSLQQLAPDGSAMPLSYYIGRASYAADERERRLLAPGEPTRIAFDHTRLTSRRVDAGSRIVVVLDVLKDGFHQINYGTGRDVSDESSADAGEPLRVEWGTDSFVQLPVRRPAAQ
jgi:putative CocE/NonD family hydrolase